MTRVSPSVGLDVRPPFSIRRLRNTGIVDLALVVALDYLDRQAEIEHILPADAHGAVAAILLHVAAGALVAGAQRLAPGVEHAVGVPDAVTEVVFSVRLPMLPVVGPGPARSQFTIQIAHIELGHRHLEP